MRKVFFIMVIGPHDHIGEQKNNFWEEETLLNSLNFKVIKKFFQHRINFDSGIYIGKGKLEEIISQAVFDKPELIYLNSVLNPAIIFRVEQKFWQINPKIIVWDRVDLILNIFEKHAFSIEAKLQIELARLKHLGPRIYGLGKQMSQQEGIFGIRGGFGETILEKMKRHIKDRINIVEKKIKQIKKKKESQIKERKEKKLPTISLVGYTNAGKTTLFNLLTAKNKTTDNRPFTTLETVLGKMKNINFPLIVSDTIGFIDNLPTFLIDAFKTTLLETLNADLIFHVVDLSNNNWQKKIDAVDKILNELKIDKNKTVLVFNKIDKVKVDFNKMIDQFNDKVFFISAKTGENINKLTLFLNEHFSSSHFIHYRRNY